MTVAEPQDETTNEPRKKLPIWAQIGRVVALLGVLVLFEQLVVLCPEKLPLAIPSLAAQLDNPVDWVRGEAVSVLGLIASDSALDLVRSRLDDRSPQVREIAHDILGLPFHG